MAAHIPNFDTGTTSKRSRRRHQPSPSEASKPDKILLTQDSSLLPDNSDCDLSRMFLQAGSLAPGVAQPTTQSLMRCSPQEP